MRGLSNQKVIARIILLAVLFCAAGGCLMLGIKVQKAMNDNVFLLSFPQKDRSFSSVSLEAAEKESIDLTYVKKLYPELSNGFRKEEAEVFATNDNYAYFAGLKIREGAFFNTVQVKRGFSVAVLNEVVAYQLFGNYDCIGENIYLNRSAFEVVGIVKEQGNETAARIYIPDEVAEKQNLPCSDIHQLWCEFNNVAQAALVIREMGYGMDELDILELRLYSDVFLQRFLVLLTVAGVAVFLYACKAAFRGARTFRQGNSIDRKQLVKWLLWILTGVGSLVVVIKMMQLSCCVPPNYELIGKGWKDSFYTILEFYTLSGVELDHMQFLREWNMLSMLCFIVCVISLLLIKGFEESSRQRGGHYARN